MRPKDPATFHTVLRALWQQLKRGNDRREASDEEIAEMADALGKNWRKTAKGKKTPPPHGGPLVTFKLKEGPILHVNRGGKTIVVQTVGTNWHHAMRWWGFNRGTVPISSAIPSLMTEMKNGSVKNPAANNAYTALNELHHGGHLPDFIRHLRGAIPTLDEILAEAVEITEVPSQRPIELETFDQPVKLADVARNINKRSDIIGRTLRTAGCKYVVVNRRAYGERGDLMKLFPQYRKHIKKSDKS